MERWRNGPKRRTICAASIASGLAKLEIRMTAEEHNQTLATLHFIYGAMHGLTLVGLLLLVFVVKAATPAADLISPRWIAIGTVAFVILLLVVGLLPLVVGYGFKKRSRW